MREVCERHLNSQKEIYCTLRLSLSRKAFFLVLLMVFFGFTQARLNEITPLRDEVKYKNAVMEQEQHRALATDTCPSEFECRVGFFRRRGGRYLHTERWTGLFPAVLTCESQCFAKFLVPYLVANNVWSCGVCG